LHQVFGIVGVDDPFTDVSSIVVNLGTAPRLQIGQACGTMGR
jgi:hypothetical protein